MASRLSDFAASTSAFAASSGDANVFCATVPCVSVDFSCLLQEAQASSNVHSANTSEYRRMLVNFAGIRDLRTFLSASPLADCYLRKPPPPPNRPPPPQPP